MDDRRRRVRLRPAVLPRHARRRRGRRARRPTCTRCGGITGLLRVGALCQAHERCRCRALRAVAARCTARCALEQFAPPRVLPRPRPHRADCCSTASLAPRDGALRPRPRPPRDRARAQASRRRALCDVAPLPISAAAHERPRAGGATSAPRPCPADACRAPRRASALPLGVEIYFEHFRGSFGDKWMWTPVALSPALSAAGVAGMRSERAARTWLPVVSALYCLDGLRRRGHRTCAAWRASPAGSTSRCSTS